MKYLRRLGFEGYLLLALMAFAAGSAVWKSRPFKEVKKFDPASAKVEATAECAENIPPPTSFDMSFANAKKLRISKEITVLLHKSEGCLRVGMRLPFRGIKRDQSEKSKIVQEQSYGSIEIVSIELKPFGRLKRGQKMYLSKKLQKPMSQISGSFYTVKVKVVDG